jgi:hypothetical protein
MDFKGLTKLDFSFATKPAAQLAAEADDSGVPPAQLVRARNRRTAMLREASAVLTCLPGEGAALHALLTGRYDLCVLLTVILERQPSACEHVRIATLAYNARNVFEITGLLDAGKVGRVTLLCSRFFRQHNPDLFRRMRDELTKRPGHKFAAARSHAKVVTMAFSDGTRLVGEGSANLRTNSNLEQFCLINSPELHAWHAAWIEDTVTRHESDQSHDPATG